MKKIILLVAVAVVLFSCKNLGEGEYEITGTVKGMKTGLVFLEKQGQMGMPPQAVDTVKIVDGKFEIKGKTAEPEIHFLHIDKLEGRVPLVLEGGEIQVTVDKDSLFKSKVGGTYSNEEFTKFNEESYKISQKTQKKSKEFEAKNKALIEEVQKTRDTAIAKRLNAEYAPIQEEAQKNMEAYTFGYPKAHPKSFISVLIIQMMSNNPKYANDIDGLYNSLDEPLKKTKPGKAIKTNLDELKKKPAPVAPPAPAVTN
ncbi:MAG: DUF4369 domain-containing protein [Flavobacterium sp.]|uniref:DUF4369 domain-containing protein n=1 Tax=Flavobacterium sp. TaxID=239 RepID=UPI003263B6A6